MIGIICAMAIELEGLIAKMENVQHNYIAKIAFTTGSIKNTKVVAVECGIGKVNAAMCTQIMIDHFNPEVIINSGVAGALDKCVTIGDTVIATNVIQHDMNTSALGDPIGKIFFNESSITAIPTDQETVHKLEKACMKENATVFKGTVASGDLFVSTLEQRKKIHDRFNALACEMEGGAVGHVCYRNSVKYCVFRVISDDLKHNEGMDFQTFCKMAAEKSINIISSFLAECCEQ